MLPYDGSSPKFVYSPDLCPIEEAFGYLKSYLKEHEDIMDVFSNPAILLQSAFNSMSRMDIRFKILQLQLLSVYLHHLGVCTEAIAY